MARKLRNKPISRDDSTAYACYAARHDVKLTTANFLVKVKGEEKSGEVKIGCDRVRILFAFTSTTICTCRVTEAMTAVQLTNCVTTLTAKKLKVPRISITMMWMPGSPHELVASVVIHRLSSFLEEDDESYEARFDPDSQFWEDNGPKCSDDQLPCLYCGDPTVDIDTVRGRHRPNRPAKREYLPWHQLKLKPDLDRDDLCMRCSPMAVCENCRCSVGGEPVCIACVEPSEVDTLGTEKQKYYNLFPKQPPVPTDLELHTRSIRCANACG